MKRNKLIKALLMANGILTILSVIWTFLNTRIYESFVDADYIAESIGQDIVSLMAGAALIIGAAYLREENIKLKAFLTGALWYLMYTYAIYAFGSVYTAFFFNYIAIMSLSLFTGILLLKDIDYAQVKTWMGKRKHYATAVFLILTAVILGLIWSASVAGNIANGTKARETVIYVMDLFFVLPAFAITAYMIIKKQEMGSYFGNICLVKAFTIGLSIVSGQLVKYIGGFSLDIFLASFFGGFTVVSGLILSSYYKSLKAVKGESLYEY